MPDLHPTDHAAPKTESRALVVVASERVAFAERPQSGFVTQLIACDRRIGVYRTARRAKPADAIVQYRGLPEISRASFQRVV